MQEKQCFLIIFFISCHYIYYKIIMFIYINENIDKEKEYQNLESDVNFMLSLISKSLSEHVKIFLPERKLIGNPIKNNLLKKYKFSSIEIVEDLNKNKSLIEIKQNRIAKDTLTILLGKDFYEKILEFIKTQQQITSSKKIDPYQYTLKILKIVLSKPLLAALSSRL